MTHSFFSSADLEEIRIRSRAKEARPVPGWPGYVMTDNGRLWSCLSRGSSTEIVAPHEVKSQTGHNSMNPNASLYNGTERVQLLWARIIAITFISPRPSERHEAQLINPDRFACSDNVRWDIPPHRNTRWSKRKIE